MNCTFCNLLEQEVPDREVVADNRAAIAWLHESRAHEGHSVVVSKRHVENLSDLSEDEAKAFLSLVRSVEKAALSESGGERAILFKLGLQVPHLHFHIYPFSRQASRDDVMRVIGGEATDHSSRDEKAAFLERMKARLATGVAR